MALDNVLKIYDEQGNPVDYDILASDVKFQDGKDLPTKLGELEEEIGEGGYTPPQGGIPKTDLAPAVQTSLDKADTAYQKPASGIPATDIADDVIPDVSGLATKTEVNTGLAGKVDKETGKGLSSNDYTDADKAAVGTIASKANDNVVVKSISVNGGTPQTPTQGNVNIEVQSGGESIVFDTDGTPIADGTLSQNADSVLAAASARWVKEIYLNLQKLFDPQNGLANIAFVGTRPTWQTVAKRTYTLTMSLSGCEGTIESGSAGNGQVYEGGVRIKLTPTRGYTFTSVMVNSVNVQTTPTGDTDGSVYVDFIANKDMSVSATATDGYGVSFASGSNCSFNSSSEVTNTSVAANADLSVTIYAKNHYTLPSTITVKVGTNTTLQPSNYTYTRATGNKSATLLIDKQYINGDIEITCPAVEDTKYSVTIDATGLTGATATPASQQVYAGENAVITVVPIVSGYSLDSVKYTVNGGSEQTATISNNQAIITIANVQATTSVVITGSASVPSVSIQHTETNCSLTMPQGTIGVGDTVTIPITAAAGYGIKDACISVKNADTDADIPFTVTPDSPTITSNSFDSKIDATLSFIANCQNVEIAVNAAVILLSGKELVGGGSATATVNSSADYCVLAPKLHAKNGVNLDSGDVIKYMFGYGAAKFQVYTEGSDVVSEGWSQAGATNGLKTITLSKAYPTDQIRAMFYLSRISDCYVKVTPSGGTETTIADFSDDSTYIILDTTQS